jgi:hypothetical protein
MKENCVSYSLAIKYIVIILAFSLLAFFIAFRLHGQGKNTYAAIFLVLSIIGMVLSTYKKKINTQYPAKKLTIDKTFLGFCFSQYSIFIDGQSKIKLYEESSLGHQGGRSTRYLILSITGHLNNENTNPSDTDVVSEHIDKNKKNFIDKAKIIADRMKMPIQNES